MPDENPAGLGAFEFPLAFTGTYRDKETTKLYNWHRNLDPATGRYLESDPMLMPNNLITPERFFAVPFLVAYPQSLHPYLYVGASPLDRSDPKGLFWPIDCIECIYYRQKLQKRQDECRNEYLQCKTLKEEIEWIERYGGHDVSSALLKCSVEKSGDPDILQKIAENCFGCGFLSGGPRPRNP